MFETEVEALLNELELVRTISEPSLLQSQHMNHGASHTLKTTTPPSTCSAVHHNVEIIDVDKLKEVVAKVGKQTQIHEPASPPCM